MEYILAVLETVPEGLPALQEELGSEAREACMTAAQKLIDQGRVEGRAEGQAEMLLRLIAARFGTPPPSIAARVRAASSVQLEQWAERVLTASSVTELFGDG